MHAHNRGCAMRRISSANRKTDRSYAASRSCDVINSFPGAIIERWVITSPRPMTNGTRRLSSRPWPLSSHKTLTHIELHNKQIATCYQRWWHEKWFVELNHKNFACAQLTRDASRGLIRGNFLVSVLIIFNYKSLRLAHIHHGMPVT